MLKLHKTLSDTFPNEFTQDTKYTSSAGPYIKIDDQTISFTLQEGPTMYQTNGIQQDEIIQFLIAYLKTLDKEKGNPHNLETIKHLTLALKAQQARTNERIKLGIEGTNQ